MEGKEHGPWDQTDLEPPYIWILGQSFQVLDFSYLLVRNQEHPLQCCEDLIKSCLCFTLACSGC